MKKILIEIKKIKELSKKEKVIINKNRIKEFGEEAKIDFSEIMNLILCSFLLKMKGRLLPLLAYDQLKLIILVKSIKSWGFVV